MVGETHDVVVVGGGAAGLSAALELARAGADVAIVDESSNLGGQYYKRRHGAILERDGDYRPAGSALIDAVHAAGVTCLTDTLVWGAEEGVLWTSHTPTGAIESIQGHFTLLATGAYEKTAPFPGWTLPGVCTPGFALHLATIDRVGVGDRVIVAGSGPFLLPVTCALLEVGVQVVRLLEVNAPYRPSPRALMTALYPARVAELARYLATLRRYDVKIMQGWRIIAAGGHGRVASVTIGQAGSAGAREEIAVDAVCVGYGFRPSTELARLMGCACAESPSGDLIPLADGSGRTSRPTVYVAGESRGVAGVQAALTRGRLAAYSIMAELGLRSAPPIRERYDRWQARRLDAFADLTAELFRVPVSLYAAIPDETVVCRCESVTAAQIRRVAAVSGSDINATKGGTRAGMGVCQGRHCGHVVAALVARAVGAPGRHATSSAFSPRTPLKPIAFPQSPFQQSALRAGLE